MFLDDLHVITDAGVTGLIRDLIASIPGEGTLFLGGRRMPDLHVGRLRTQGHVLEIGPDDLRFTTSESEQLVANILGRRLQPDLVTSLQERTDGWAAVLQLAALSLRKRNDPADYVAGFSASSAELGSYLTEEILATQPEEIRELMLRSSVCSTICADLCDEICGTHRQRRAAGADRTRQPVPVPPRPGGRVVPLPRPVRGLPPARAAPPPPRRDPGTAPARGGLVRAARPETSALEHALLCGDTDYAADMADEFAQPLTAAGRLITLIRAAQPLPKASVDRRPRLKVYYTVCLSGAFQHRTAAPLLEELSAADVMASLDPVTRGALLFAIPFQMMLQDRFADALTAAEAHVPKLDPDDAQNRTALFNVRNVCLLHLRRFRDIDEVESEVHALATGVTTYGLVYAECIAGMSELAQGRLSNATATFEAALTTAIDDSSPNSAPTAIAAACLAEALYEAGQVERAEELLDRHLPTITHLAIPDGVIHAHALHIRIAYRRHGYEQACDAIHQLKRLGYERDLWRVVATAWAEQSRLALLQGDLPAADRYLHMAEANGPYSTLWDESSATLRARLLTAHGRPAEALEQLDAELAGLDTEICRRQALKLRVVRATVLKAAGRNTEALRVIAECVEEARRASYVRLLVDEGPALAALLRELLARRTADPESRAFVGTLLEQLDDEHRAATTEPDEPREKLSARELEVLGRMADACRTRRSRARSSCHCRLSSPMSAASSSSWRPRTERRPSPKRERAIC